MRNIKFRGTTPEGEIVYGDLTHHNGNIFIDDKRVNPDSVAQLVGLDFNGDEIYEGDTVTAYGKEYPVKLSPKYGLFYNLKYAVKK